MVCLQFLWKLKYELDPRPMHIYRFIYNSFSIYRDGFRQLYSRDWRLRLQVLKLNYRVSHETWQLVKSCQCLLPYAVLDIIDFLQFITLKKTLLKYILLRNQFYYNITDIKYFLLFSLVTNNLTYYGRRHFKLCIKCFGGHHVPNMYLTT